MLSQYSDSEKLRALQTLESIEKTISRLIKWNKEVASPDVYYDSEWGMQLLTANCTLITAIGEGVNRINRLLPKFLSSYFSDVPWHAIIGMRNHIAHGYFELDADLVFEAITKDIPPLLKTIEAATTILQEHNLPDKI